MSSEALRRATRICGLASCLLALGCAADHLPEEGPNLIDLEEPLSLRSEPDDEVERQELPLGGFTGLIVGEPARALDADSFGLPPGLPVASVVQNSPAHAAGVQVGDLLVSVGRGAGELLLEWASEWRELELGATPGGRLWIVLDRAGRELELELEVVARLAPAPRQGAQRFRETDRVGLVLRSATEVEARAGGLAPGAGAVVVGLSAGSPWRAGARGVLFADLLTEVEGQAVAHPQLVLDAIRAASPDGELKLAVVRDGAPLRLKLPVSRRASELREIHVPLIFSYRKQSDSSSTSMLLGLFRFRRTRAAWDVRLLWLLSFGGGDADRLEEVR